MNCPLCKKFIAAIPPNAPGITARQAAEILENEHPTEGIMTARAVRLLQDHGWQELPHPIHERHHGARFAPPNPEH